MVVSTEPSTETTTGWTGYDARCAASKLKSNLPEVANVNDCEIVPPEVWLSDWRNAAWVPLGALAAPHALPLASMPALPVKFQFAVAGS